MTGTSQTSVTSASRIGGPDEVLTEAQLRGFIAERLAAVEFDGRSVCVIVPDGTRSCPLPLLLSVVHGALHGRVTHMTVLIALGTHAAMSEHGLATHLGYPVGGVEERYPGTTVRNHEWWDPSTFVDLGTISADRIAELSDGMLRETARVRINRAVIEHDVTLIVGPVFPHEVVGISGGNKYLFPGVSGRELIDLTHWLGALITSAEIIGTTEVTPVRAMINEAASLVPGERYALCVVTASGHSARAVAPDSTWPDADETPPADTSVPLYSASFGEPHDAWKAAADIAAKTHVIYLDAPVRRVLSVVPTMYDDIWTGAKGFYKVEPVVADHGQVVVYAPHIREISAMHPEIAEIGYHCRDYFVKQWDRFKQYPWGDLAHSTHLAGAGTYNDVDGERLRVTVTLATGIPEQQVRAANLDHLDPAEVDPDAWAADPDTLVVRRAGEDLYRLRPDTT